MKSDQPDSYNQIINDLNFVLNSSLMNNTILFDFLRCSSFLFIRGD